MSAIVIQDDYGGFDLTFIGVTLRFWPKSWDLFQKVSVLDREPAEVVRLGNAALAGDPNEAFEVFSTGTVMLHELRHFHDFILSPFGNQILRLRMAAAVNGLHVLAQLKRSKTLVPVPIPKWRRMPKADQLAALEQWKLMLDDMPPEPDFAFPGEVGMALEQAETAYAAVRNLVSARQDDTGIAYHPYHVMEASAIAAQANNVYTVFGERHAELFLNRMLNSPEAADYALLMRAWYAMCQDQGVHVDLALFSAAVTWSLLGDYGKEGWSACPTVRFARLFELLMAEGLPDFDQPAIDLLGRWSEKLETPAIPDTFAQTQHSNRKLLAKLSDLYDDDDAAALLPAFRSFIEMQEKMVALFQENPDHYVRPDLYAEQCEKWVAAPIRFDFPNMPLVGDREKLNRSLSVRVARELDGDRLAVRRALAPGQTLGEDVIVPEVAATASDTMTLIDFFFAEFRRDEPDFDVTRQVIAAQRMCAVELL